MKGAGFMDEFGCDYECRTVGESIAKYDLPNDWHAEFEAYDGVYPIIYMQLDQIRKSPAIMNLKLRIVENEDDEYAGCIILKHQKTVVFKVDHMSDLIRATGAGSYPPSAPPPAPAAKD